MSHEESVPRLINPRGHSDNFTVMNSEDTSSQALCERAEQQSNAVDHEEGLPRIGDLSRVMKSRHIQVCRLLQITLILLVGSRPSRIERNVHWKLIIV